MSWITRILKQKAAYWATPVDNGYGEFTFDDPVTVSCRWEGKQEIFTAPDGRQQVSRAVVYLAQDVSPGNWLYLGTAESLDSSVTGPEDVSGAYMIRAAGKSWDTRGKKYLVKAWL